MFADKNSDVEIVSVYVESPLQWGVHVRGDSPLVDERGLTPSVRIAISRFGSGSHLMAFVFAERMGWDASKLTFVAVGGLSGALKAFQEDSVDLFLWDSYMTSPLVLNGTLKKIGVLPSPWPCFVVASTKQVLATRRKELTTLLETVSKRAHALQHDERSVEMLCTRYHLSKEIAEAWLTTTKFAAMPLPLSDDVAKAVRRYLPK